MSTAFDAVVLRRDIHRHPEVGFTEFRTASRLAGQLQDLGWAVTVGADVMDTSLRRGVPPDDELDRIFRRAEQEGGDPRYLPSMRGGTTAVVAELHGRRSGPTIGIRAELDALPVREPDDDSHLPARDGFRSAYDGVMHACGHDGNLAMAIDLAHRLSAGSDFAGVVRLFLQPAEEGVRGARCMVGAGVADDVDLFLAPHVGLGLATGNFAPAGPILLSTSKFRATFRGLAAHAGNAPQEGQHALLAAAASILALHSLPQFGGHATRLNVGRVEGGTASNVVPDLVTILFETRADDQTVSDELEARAATAVSSAAAMFGVTVELERVGGVSAGTSDAGAIARIEAAAAALDLPTVLIDHTGSDDAAEFMNRVQARGGHAAYLGVGATMTFDHHTSRFDFDEAALRYGADLLETLVRQNPTYPPSIHQAPQAFS